MKNKELKVDFVSNANANETLKKDAKKSKKKDKKPGIFRRIGARLKDTFSELKKVIWPTFPKVVKQTGVVLVVVIIFLIVITAFDFGLLHLLGLMTGQQIQI